MKKRAFLILLCSFVLFMSCSVGMFAAPVSADCSLTLSFKVNGTPIEGATFKIYKIADLNADGSLTVTEQFKKYPVFTNDSDSFRNLATTLESYVLADSIPPTMSGKTDADGILIFDGLSAGDYLVIGDKFVKDGETLIPKSFIATLPQKDVNADLSFDIVANVKWESEKNDSFINLEVLKIWEDGDGLNRPDSVTVELYADGKLFDTAVLKSSNSWRYNWTNLSADKVWTVKEKIISYYYIVTVEKQGDRFVITNKRVDEPYNPDKPNYPENPDVPNDTTKPDETTDPENTTKPSDGGSNDEADKEPQLPVTGLLWWPVPVLVCFGIIFIIMGIAAKRRAPDEKR